MKSETRRARMAALIAEDEDDPIFDLLPKEEPEKPQEQINAEESNSRGAEAILAFLRGEYFVNKICKECEGVFLTSYGNVAYCKDACRIEALKKMGITWDTTKPLHQRWGNKIPLVIPQETLQELQERIQLAFDQRQDSQNNLSESNPVQQSGLTAMA